MRTSMSASSTTNDRGFTIIEVLIVIAIAALILLVVFLAVPALQRNARNSSRQHDASRLYTAVNTYLTSHPELTLRDGPNQLLKQAGQIISNQGEAGKMQIYDNSCSVNEGSALGDTDRGVWCDNGDPDAKGVYMFRETNSGYRGYLGPYVNSGSAFSPDTIHIMIGAKCDQRQAGDPPGDNYSFFIEQNARSMIAVGYALETGSGTPHAICYDL